MTEMQKEIEGDIGHYLQQLNITFMAEHKELERVSNINDKILPNVRILYLLLKL